MVILIILAWHGMFLLEIKYVVFIKLKVVLPIFYISGFSIMFLPLTSCRFCLDIECRTEGLVAIRDGAYSVFDKQKAVEEFSAINSIKVGVEFICIKCDFSNLFLCLFACFCIRFV